MVMTLERAMRTVTHAAYGDPSVHPLDIVNEAGIRLMSMHPWRWAVKPPVQISLRAPITFTGATWTEATLTLSGLTLTGYVFANGDSMTISSGTGATARDYTLVSANVAGGSVVFSETLGAAADGNADMAGTLNASQAVVLPSDFGMGITAYVTTQGLTQHLSLCSQQTLVSARSKTPSPPIGVFWGSVFTAPDLSTAGGVPTNRLEIYPEGDAGDADFITISYRLAWSDLTEDAKVISIPPYIEPLFTAMLRGVTRGYEEEEQGTVEDHMDRIMQGSTFMTSCINDGLVQPNTGELTSGNENMYGQEWWPYPTGYTADP